MKHQSDLTASRSVLPAVKWAFIMQWGHRGIATLLTLVLAAILGPTAFGIVAMAMVYIAFIEMFLEQGLTAALIQRKELEPEHLDSTFWMVLVFGLMLTGASVILSGWWASVNKVPELSAVINALSLLIPVKCLTVVQQAILQREMSFKRLAVRATASVFIGGIVGIAMVLSGFGVWSLVGQKLAEGVSALVLLWSLSQWRPRLRFSRSHLKDMLSFSGATFLAKLGLFAANRMDVMLIGLFFGPMVVGLYRIADRLIGTLLEFTTRPLNLIALPQFSRVQDDRPALRDAVLSTMHLSSCLAIPSAGVLAGASTAILAVLGPQWAPAVDALRLMCLLGALLAMIVFTGSLLQAVGKPYVFAMLTWTLTVVSAGSLVTVGVLMESAAVERQVFGIAVARVAVVGLLSLTILFVILRRVCDLSPRRLLVTILPSLVAGLGGGALATGLGAGTWSANLPPLGRLVLISVPAAVSAFGLLLLLDRTARRVVFAWLSRHSGTAQPSDPSETNDTTSDAPCPAGAAAPLINS